MSRNEKRWIILLVAVIVIAIVLIVGLANGGKNDEIQQGEGEPVVNEEIYTTELSDGTKLNTSEDLSLIHI